MSTNAITMHPELAQVLDGPSAADRLWFLLHPGEVCRIRPQFPEEVEARTAMAEVIGQPMLYLEGLTPEGRPLPRSHMAVVDVMRLEGLAHGPDGESGRCRIECPAPTTTALGEEIKEAAMAAVRGSLAAIRQQQQQQRRRDRRSGKRGGS